MKLTLTAAAFVALAAGGAFAASHESEAAADDAGATMEVAGDAEAGETVFRKCMACHAVGERARNKVGPILNGVVGRDVASIEDYRYSSAMEEWGADKVWTPEELSAYLEDPRGVVQGTKMAFAGLSDQADRDNVIAYLATFEADM